MDSFLQQVVVSWKSAFSNKGFRITFFTGLIILITFLAMLPIFYGRIEARDGYIINDWLLARLTPRDVSIPIFMIVWGAAALGIYRSLLRPSILMHFFYAYLVFIITRSTCLVFIPLDPPLGIVPLKDPLTNIFYGGVFMKKDLFYSGHTCAVVIICLLLQKKADKILLGASAFILIVLLLLQHVHYTIDVLAAVPFAFICLFVSNFIVKKGVSLAKN